MLPGTRSSTLGSTTIWELNAAILCAARALEIAEGERVPWTYAGWWLAALLCVAGGVLTKWTAPAFFYGTLIPLLWWRGRLRLLFGLPKGVKGWKQ